MHIRWLLLLVLLLVGCSSTESAPQSAEIGPTPGATPLQVTGKFFLSANVANATVTAEAADGTELARATTDASGNFYLPGSFPAEFRVVGQLGGVRFVTQVREGRRFVVLNVPNALVSRFLETNPAATLAQAEARVARQLGLTEGNLGWLEDGPRTSFSHLNFLVAAAAQGGYSAFSQRLVTSLQPAGRFQLTRRDLAASLTGLEPELAAVARRAQEDPVRRASLKAQRNDQLLGKLSKEGEVSAAGFGSFLLTGVGGSIVSDITNNLLGWITTSLGWNVGTAGGLNEIQNELTALMNDLNTLALEGAIVNADASLSGYVSSTNTLITQEGSAVKVATNSNTTNLPNLPSSSSSSELVTLLSSLSSYAATNNLQQFARFMLGTDGVTNLIMTNLKQVLNQNYGIQQANGQTFPVRSSFLLDRTLQTFNYYAGQQALTANFLVEQAHPALPVQAPAINLLNAQAVLSQTAYSLALQRQQLPCYPLSDNVMVDLQNGLMWYTEVQAATTWDQANQNASNFQVIGSDQAHAVLSQWRLPTLYEYGTLQQRGRYVSTSLRDSSAPQNGGDSSYGNYGYVLQGLSAGSSGVQGLGFTGINQINSDGDVWYADWVQIGQQWTLYSGNEFRLNHESDTTASKSGSTQLPYLMVRSLGPSLLPGGTTSEQGPGPNGTGAPPVMNFNNLVPQEGMAEGSVSDLGANLPLPPVTSNVTINLTNTTGGTNTSTVTFPAQFLTCYMGLTMQLGGKFSYGSSSQSSANNPTASYTLGPLSVGGTQGNFTDLIPTLAFNITSGNATVLNYPGLQGLVLYHQLPPLPNGITATFIGNSFNTTNSLNDQFLAAPPAITLNSILISPRNFLFTNGNLTSNQGLQYYCTGYYSDGSVADLTNQVTWSVFNTASGQASPGAFFSGSALAFNGQPLPQTMSQALYTVKASLGNVTDSTNAQLGQPPNS